MFFRKNLLAVLATLLAVQISHAGWWKTFGGLTNDYGYCVQITSDSNYIISGYKEGSGLWLIKTDTSGTPLWSTTYGEEIRGGEWVEETSDANFIVACWTPTLLKVTALGDTIWTNDCGFWVASCVQETADGNYIVVGSRYEGNNKRLALSKISSEGNTIWSRQYGNPSRNRNSGSFIRQDPDGGFIITGTTGEETEEFATMYLWLIKTDADGDTVWTREYGNGGLGEFNSGNCVQRLEDGGYIITGRRESGEIGLWILRIDENGDTLWTKTYDRGTGKYIEKTGDGGYIIAGGTEDEYHSLNPQLSDLWLIKTDSLGDSLWSRIYGGNESDAGYCVRQTTDEGYIVVGETWSFGSGGRDIYLLKTDSLGLLGIKEDDLSETVMNWEVVCPVGVEVLIKYSKSYRGFRANVYDALGRRIDEFASYSSSGTLVWGQGYPSGVYFIKVADNPSKTERVIIVR